MSASLVARGLARTFREGGKVVEVLTGVDLEVAPGELVGIVGPSGSGKSTLLHLLGGLDRPDSGRVEISGTRLDELAPADLAAFRNRNIGFIFQFHQLLPDFTALENVMIPARIARHDARASQRRARQFLEEVGLGHRLDHFPNELSGGERQRVAICRALALEPPLLLADEPTGNLDPDTGRRVLDLLLDLQAGHGMSAVLVTHNPLIADRCAKLLRLEGGVLAP